MRLHRNWLVLGAALLVGVVAAVAVQRYIKDRMAALQPKAAQGPTVSVVVATGELTRGTRLDSSNVAVRKVPREWAHSQAIKPDDFERMEQAVLATNASRGEAILWSQLVGKPTPSFSTRLASGRRAVTVPVDEISSISGMVAPGDAIDLMAALRQEGKVHMLPVLQDVKVLATGTQVQPGKLAEDGKPRSFTTVTLDATP
jgi:pilus assembly protein CpaB